MSVLLTPPYLQFFDTDGVTPLSGGKVYTFSAGTTTPKATFETAAGVTQAPNPVILNAIGVPESGNGSIWITGSYKIVVKDSNDVEINSTDNVTAFTALPATSNSYFESFSGTGSQTSFTASDDLGTDEKAIYVWINDGLAESVTNGDFATDTDWTKGAGWVIGSGVATATTASTAISQTSAITLVEGQAYALTYTITQSAGSIISSIGGNDGTSQNATGTYTEVIIAGSTEILAFTGTGFTGTLDDVSVTVASTAGFDIQDPSAFTIAGTALTFAVAPPAGTNNIYVSAPSLLVGAASSSAADAAASAADAAADAISTAADVVTTNADVVSTNADVVITNDDVVSTNADVVTASEWASKITGLVAAADYSAKAWAIGGTGTATNNAKYYSEQAAGAVTGDILPMTEQGSTPSTPATGVSKLYFKTDNSLYRLDDAGTEINVSLPDDNSVTLAKIAPGTAGNVPTYDASGNPAVAVTGVTGALFSSNGVGTAPTMKSINDFTTGTVVATDKIIYSATGDSNLNKSDEVQGLLDLILPKPLMEVFTASGTWIQPTDITEIKVTVIAGGGGGAGSGGDGVAGGSSSFGAFCSATGGSKGEQATTLGGIGGVGSGGDLNINGGDGSDGAGNGDGGGTILAGKAKGGGAPSAGKKYGGGGGAWTGSGGGGGGGTAIEVVTVSGNVTVTVGSGGATGAGSPGGAGADGVVIVEYVTRN